MPAYNPATRIARTSNLRPETFTRPTVPNLPTAPTEPPDQPDQPGVDHTDAVDSLHSLCGIYTKPAIVERLLDLVGWTPEADLAAASLLEPGAGDGAFLVEAAQRLVDSFVRRKLRLDIKSLRGRILAYELAPREANKARDRIVTKMRSMGVNHNTARACASAWVRTEDFLLAKLPHANFTHIVGNPPYVRWSKLPRPISGAYAQNLPKDIARGDLHLPFLHRAFEHLASRGRCAFICSDRWRYAVYARDFRAKWDPAMHFTSQPAGQPKDAFDRDVYVHPEILTARRRETPGPQALEFRSRGKRLADLGCKLRVGPALGVKPAFIVEQDEADVEPDLLYPWIDSREVRQGHIEWSGRRVISPFDHRGDLVDLQAYPRFATRLRRFEPQLRGRYIVRNGAAWYRTIDKIIPADWSAPKLLIPEVAKFPRVAIDRTGAIPSHGVYCIFFPGGNIEEIYDRLRDGRLAKALAPIAPKIKGRYTRCYRRFLDMMEV